MKSALRSREPYPHSFRWRAYVLLGVLSCAALGLLWRAIELQLVDHTFLVKQGDARYSRVVTVAAHRGTITDRYGEPLAVSTPVDSIWANPKELALAADEIPRLARALKLDATDLARRVTSNLDREFLWIARHRQPAEAQKIKALGIPGVYLMREYRRYYPAGEVAGHILGFTNIDDAGQEGLELAFDHWLAGEDGAKRVIQDRYGRSVDVDSVRPVRPGRDLVLSIDLRIQYLAYRELKSAIRRHRARAGSVVVLDVTTGEVLAMVNQPAYNPNNRADIAPKTYRNRAATDIFEPGSVVKPFVVAAGLSSGKYTEHSIIDTSPGFYKVGAHVFEDEHGSLGAIDLATILARSSNVGMARLALSLEPQQMWTTLHQLGFGQVTMSGYPGESAGLLSHYSHWRPIGIATMSRGYGISVTPLQLASAYATVGAYGVRRPVSFLRVDEPPQGQRALSPEVCRAVLRMLERVIAAEGTGRRAAIPGYRVSGKTGTAWKAMAGGYATDRYMSVFGGVAPATAPRLAAIVVIDEPGAGAYYGGEVAAPVFSAVVGGALRLMAVPPDEVLRDPSDDMDSGGQTLAQAAGVRR
ncbi:MAG TPA: penicillin-binding transpeptidase domain-containing protein [Steroidobacteraceae bacterium]